MQPRMENRFHNMEHRRSNVDNRLDTMPRDIIELKDNTTVVKTDVAQLKARPCYTLETVNTKPLQKPIPGVFEPLFLRSQSLTSTSALRKPIYDYYARVSRRHYSRRCRRSSS